MSIIRVSPVSVQFAGGARFPANRITIKGGIHTRAAFGGDRFHDGLNRAGGFLRKDSSHSLRLKLLLFLEKIDLGEEHLQEEIAVDVQIEYFS